MAFNVSQGAAYAVLYSILVAFTLLAIASAGYFHRCLPDQWTGCCLLKLPQDEEEAEGGEGGHNKRRRNADHFLAARNSAGVTALALSYFASGMGAWVVYGTTEMGATPALSWLGVIGYSSASALPAVLIGYWLGPKIRARNSEAFSTTDFGLDRYGRVMQVVIGVLSIFYMFIFLVAELTAISNIFALMTNDWTTLYGVSITVSIGIFTIAYTAVAGLPASIATDKFQGVIMAVLVLLLTIVVAAVPENQVTREQFSRASNWTVDGLMAAITLLLAVSAAELFNQSTWQRVWAAESVPVMRKGFLLGSGLVFLLMMFFGVMGMIAYALDPVAYDSGEKFAYLAFFDLLEPLVTAWHVVVLILVTALAASSIDSLQNGLTSVLAGDLVKIGWNPTWVARALMVAVNVPAIYLASKQYEVLSLFLVADLVCATSVFPVFLGLQTNDRLVGWLKAPTELGAFLGCLSGIAAVLVNGVINDADGGLFAYFWLQNGAMCALCGSKTMVSFIVTPAVSAVMTYVFSWLDVAMRGERARHPIFRVAFDQTKPAELTEGFDGDDEEEVVLDDDNVEADKNLEETEAAGNASSEATLTTKTMSCRKGSLDCR